MLARRVLPEEYRYWNRRHGAPFGHRVRGLELLHRLLPEPVLTRRRGPFGIQENNTVREFEYPWAYLAIPVRAGLDVLDIGGGLGGFQFVLAREGCRVVNVDPGMDAVGVGWPCDESSMRRLNRRFGTSVQLRNTVIERAELADQAFDVAYSISVLEHLPPDELITTLEEVYRVLRPGGHFVMTVDLFLNIAPFTSVPHNKFGTNVDLRWLLGLAPFELAAGTPSELHGFEGFSPEWVLSNLADLLVGEYPALCQCLVLRKP
jgi:SAM-dependent methyltransferase